MEETTDYVTGERETGAQSNLQQVLDTDVSILIDCAHNILKTKSGLGDMSALDLAVELKRAEAFVKALQLRIRGAANLEFNKLQTEDYETKQWTIYDGRGIIRKTSPKAVWKFPDFITTLEKSLNEAKNEAKSNKSATRTLPSINPLTTAMFSITLTESFE